MAGPMRAAAKAYDVPFIEQQVAGLGCESELYQTGGSDVGAGSRIRRGDPVLALGVVPGGMACGSM